MAPEPLPVLDLRDEAAARPFILYEGSRYHYKLKSDLSLDEYLLAVQIGQRFEQFGSDTSITGLSWWGRIKFKRDIRRCVEIIMYDMPKRVARRKLTEQQCMSIIESFSTAQPASIATSRPARSGTSSRASASTTRARRGKS